jgi:hypothetical protein
MPYVGFGVAFADLDNDGWPDVVIANGHVRNNVRELDPAQDYAQPIQVFRNGRGRFADVSRAAFSGSPPVLVGRGLSVADYDQDGRPDLLVCDLEGEALLLRNVSPPGNWLQVRLRSPGMNRDGLGARVTVRAGGTRQVREVRTCGSVLSALAPVAHFGLGRSAPPARITVRWPDGVEQSTVANTLNRRVTIDRRHP